MDILFPHGGYSPLFLRPFFLKRPSHAAVTEADPEQKIDKLTALAVFREVARQSSFGLAGRRLGLSSSAVSKNIAELEMTLGVRLLQRTTRRVGLTEEGRRYLIDVSRALDALAEADEALTQGQATASGLLRVSAPLAVSMTRLVPALPRFLSRHPEVELDLDLNDRRVDIVRDGYDMAIRGTDQLEDSSLIARRLAAMTHVVCASPAYLARHGTPQRPRDLADHACLRFSLSQRANQWRFQRGRVVEEVSVRGPWSMSTSLGIRSALLDSVGLALIPQWYVADDLAAGRLRQVLHDWHTADTILYVIYPSRQHLPLRIRVFIDFAFEVLGGTSTNGPATHSS